MNNTLAEINKNIALHNLQTYEKKTPLIKEHELILMKAQGDHTSKVTQAARRVCIKLGLDWTQYTPASEYVA